MEGPLEGIRILDFTRITAGPYGSLLLADLGAEVIKIEAPTSKMRQVRGMLDTNAGEKYDFSIKGIATHYLAMNRNKKSIALNMRHEKGREIFRDLVKVSDVVLDNFRAGTTKKMGIDFEALSQVNPRIVTFSINAYGESGPLSGRGGFDPIGQALGGGMSVTTGSDGAPVRPGIS